MIILKNTIPVISITGTMLNDGNWWSYEMGYIVKIIRQTVESDSVSGIINMLGDSGIYVRGFKDTTKITLWWL